MAGDSPMPADPGLPTPERIDTSMFEWAKPPQEWLDEERKKALMLVATASIGPTEPTEAERTQAALARTLLWFGSRIEALEKRVKELEIEDA